MPVRQSRKVVLRSGRKSTTLELGEGHVWETDASGSIGHPVHDPKQERALLEKLVRGWVKQGYRIAEDTGLVTSGAPRRPAGTSARTRGWIEEADECLAMWKDDDYDNYKDAILDARSLLRRPPEDQAKRTARLEKMLARAESELKRLAARDPEIADYARGLVELPPAKPRRAAPKKAAKRKSTRGG
jgi:hypothetical protein